MVKGAAVPSRMTVMPSVPYAMPVVFGFASPTGVPSPLQMTVPPTATAPHSLAAQADDAPPKAAVAKTTAPSVALEDFLPRALQTSLAATQAPSASFQMLLNDRFIL